MVTEGSSPAAPPMPLLSSDMPEAVAPEAFAAAAGNAALENRRSFSNISVLGPPPPSPKPNSSMEDGERSLSRLLRTELITSVAVTYKVWNEE